MTTKSLRVGVENAHWTNPPRFQGQYSKCVGWLVKIKSLKSTNILGDYPRFLNEPGQRTIKSLQQAAVREIEFDVHIEILAALDRLEGGRKTQRPM
jgi:hypothetical protein